MCLRTARSGRVRGFDARDLCSGLRGTRRPFDRRPTEEARRDPWADQRIDRGPPNVCYRGICRLVSEDRLWPRPVAFVTGLE